MSASTQCSEPSAGPAMRIAPIAWQRYPLIRQHAAAHQWLLMAARTHTTNTVAVYARGLEDYLAYCSRCGLRPENAGEQDIVDYARFLAATPCRRRVRASDATPPAQSSPCTLRLRLGPVRHFYDDLCLQGECARNPFRTGEHTLAELTHPAGDWRGSERPCCPVWLPAPPDWAAIMAVLVQLPLRDRLFLALLYETMLHPAMLTGLDMRDFELSTRLVRMPQRSRRKPETLVLPYSQTVATLYTRYLREERPHAPHQAALFLSRSNRTFGQRVAFSTWFSLTRRIRCEAGVPRFRLETVRHLRLFDLAVIGHNAAPIAARVGLTCTARKLTRWMGYAVDVDRAGMLCADIDRMAPLAGAPFESQFGGAGGYTLASGGEGIHVVLQRTV